MMSMREPLEWHFKQLDDSVGLSFKSNFHFALVGHLLKGYRHPTTITRTSRVLTMLLTIVAKSSKRDKFEVTPVSVPYLAGTFVIPQYKINNLSKRMPEDFYEILSMVSFYSVSVSVGGSSY